MIAGPEYDRRFGVWGKGEFSMNPGFCWVVCRLVYLPICLQKSFITTRHWMNISFIKRVFAECLLYLLS